MPIGQPLLRAMRAAVFAAVCVLVSAALHGFAGGEPARLEVLLGASALAWAGAYLLGGSRRGMGTLLAACFATQYGMHHLFGVGAAASVQPGHEHGTGVGMFLVHAVTALISAWWLERGESALAVLLQLAATTVRRWWRVLLILAGGLGGAGTHDRRPSRDEHVPFPGSRFAAAISRRGPPARLSLV
ncbi:hypothetical protein HTZ77_25100 [Nonomuraea sp. SMC257]|uniref:Uncharacterized protein n=1 Tax=Nonomuraea montanisoli TaxID=2741721 RepID=A0A7Y6IAV0_9ACTN|nr:hypothetical protein [Nonomuraea montanisoli]NUW34686.1 hypothetical protein [Nonomuraea montanisoli]